MNGRLVSDRRLTDCAYAFEFWFPGGAWEPDVTRDLSPRSSQRAQPEAISHSGNQEIALSF
jgi:hypothetical protein